MHHQISSVKFNLEEAWVSPFKKFPLSVKKKKLPLNIIRICICAISGVLKFSDICLVNLFIQIFVQYIMWHPNIFGYLFVSIL